MNRQPEITQLLQRAAREAIQAAVETNISGSFSTEIDGGGVGFSTETAATASNELPIAYVRVNFKAPSDQKYFEIVQVINDPADRYRDDGNQVYQGLFRILLHWPKLGGGDIKPMTALADVAAQFTKGQQLYGENITVQITDSPKIRTPIDNDKDLLYPLSMTYSCFG